MAYINQDHARNRIFGAKDRKYSIKHRLLIRVSAVLLIAWVVGAVYAKVFSFQQTRGLLYEQSSVLSQNLITLVGSHTGNSLIDASESTQLFYGWQGNELVIRQGVFDLPAPSRTQTYVKELDGINWVLSSHCENGNCVVVGFQDQARKYLTRRIVSVIFMGIFLVLVLAMVAMYYAINSALKPLEMLAKELIESDVSKLQNISGYDKARELKPLSDALNQLMDNMSDQLEKERQFLDTCTHELRTPVAGLVAQIQSFSARSTQNSQYQSIRLAADRTIRMANQFLGLAKNRNAQALVNRQEKFDLPELIRQLSADILLLHKNTNCQLLGSAKLMITADSIAMEMVIRNLLENACRYGKAPDEVETQIIISLNQIDSVTYLTVEDAGSGVSEAHLTKLTQRFFRSPDSSCEQKESFGAGLGLSIVEEVANSYTGKVSIDQSPALGGLRVSVSFKNIACVNQAILDNEKNTYLASYRHSNLVESFQLTTYSSN